MCCRPELVTSCNTYLSLSLCRVSWHAADGRICAELLCPYPPGIPAAVPGEVLSEALLIGLRQLLLAGGVVTGAADPELNTICIVSP